MRLRNCLGMIWSVSTLVRSSGAAIEVRVLNGCMLGLYLLKDFPVADINEVTGDGSGSGHFGRNEVRAPAATLAAFEVAIARRGAAFARRKNVRIHAEAHRAARLTPVEACIFEYLVEALLF